MRDLEQVTDRKGQVTTYTYDALDRLTETTYDDTSTTAYTYDAGDRMTEVDDSLGGTISRTYDLLNRLTNETTPEGSVSYTYDAADRRASMTVAGQSAVSYAYDDANRLTTITQGTSTVSFAYDDGNRRTSLTLPNGIEVTYDYDSASQLTGLTYTLGSTTLGTLTYTYDLAGNRTEVGGTWARTNLPATLSSATYDAANQITTWNSTSFTYDGNGNLTNDGVRTYTWNPRNELTALAGPISAAFGYDGTGRRRTRTVAGVTTSFLYDCLNLLQEISGGSVTANFLIGASLDEVFMRVDSSGSSVVLSDALRSSIALADAGASLATTYTYEAFGETSSSGQLSASSVQYTGRENDGTDLYFYRARYYRPALQRFISEDPLGLAAGPNLFAYVYNAPTLFTDPLGLKPDEGQDQDRSRDGDRDQRDRNKNRSKQDCGAVAQLSYAACLGGALVALGLPVEFAIVLSCAGVVPCVLAAHHAALPAYNLFMATMTVACAGVADRAYRQCSGIQ